MSEPHDPLIGSVLADRYQILARLGGGGMGSIYRGLHVTLNRPVAIKVLAPELARDPKLVARFLREARAAAAVTHENTVDIEDVDALPDGSAFFVMELLDGRDLDRVLREEGRLAWPRARDITVQIARALAATHAAGIVHRDMKPANVFLVARGGIDEFVKVIDFGVAKVHDEARLTREGMVLGTAGYMAPEQIMSGEVDARADVYAVTCMLFEMLGGRRPFVADSVMKVFAAHIREPPPRLCEVAPDLAIPSELELLIQRGLAKLPEHRLADMLELERALLAVPTLPEPSTAAAPRHHGSSEAVAPTQMLEQPAIVDPRLQACAVLYLVIGQAAAGVDPRELQLIHERLQRWMPGASQADTEGIVREAAAMLDPLSRESERIALVLRCADELAASTERALLREILADLWRIAGVDGQIAAAEQRLIMDVVDRFQTLR